MVKQLQHQQDDDPPLEKTKSLISALNYVSRDLPLPCHLYDSVSSIYNASVSDLSSPPLLENSFSHNGGDLMREFEDALLKQRPNCESASRLTEFKETRLKTHIQHRLCQLKELPSTRGEDLQEKCLLELYGLKLRELQCKVRDEVRSEYWLRLNCVHPQNQLYDWGIMRLPRPFYGIGDPLTVEADDQFRKKRDEERLLRLAEEEKNLIETSQRKFFAEVLNAVREFQLQIQASQKQCKQRNDFVQAWHGKQRQRATRAEKLRIMALKSDDQEAYMKLAKESKNEKLTLFLEETNKIFVSLGAAVQRQKDAKLSEAVKLLQGSESDLSEVDAPQDVSPDQDIEIIESDNNDDSNDLLEGERQFNLAIHSIQEKVTKQPSLLQGGELRSYQLEGLQWMVSLYNNDYNGILADEMGLGKTIQTIALIAYLLETKNVLGPHLILAPKAVLPNWENEFATWAPSIAAFLYDGPKEKRNEIRARIAEKGKFNVLITHYDLVMRDKTFLKKIEWNYMIVDEGHRLKNHDCALARILGTGYRIKRRLLLTGTPIQNSLQELWSLLNFLLPHIFNSVQNFEEWFNTPFAERGSASLTDEEELLIINRLHHVIRPFLLRRKKVEVEKFLPGKTQVILKCDMSAWQKLYYKQVTDVGRVGLQTGNGKSKSLQNLSMQLRKCCNHPYLFVGGEYNMWKKPEIVRASGKFELLDRLLPKLKKAGHRILLFSQMTRLIDLLEIYLTLNDYKYLRLDGTTKTDQRGVLLKQFNEPDSPYFMFLLSTRAGGLGLNLQTADTVIIFDSDWNPQMDQQAEDRAHRIGQKKEVRVFVLVSIGSVEEVILERAKQKMGIDAKVIQAGLFNTTSTAQDRREMLEEIMSKGTSSLGEDVPSETEINRLAARTEDEFWMFEQMDEERRKRENYKTRLMEEKEVPEWAYTSETQEDKSKDSKGHFGSVTGKRKRKEAVYSDSLSDAQWMKAMESEEDEEDKKEDVPVVSQKRRRRDTNTSMSNGSTVEAESSESKEEEEEEETKEESEEENEKPIFSWNTYKKKRSSYSLKSSSPDSRGKRRN
ncbi:putative ATP-dependent DNA helicase CHR23 [Cardamine amara subsp. amara]|uniref:DNA helicase n=1 Tax=Cardamine amara subsp. amara TaxID=228776 RepID=A0ABD1AJ74_CARAN